MQDDRDYYEIYYADKLWNLLPAIYRALDTDAFDRNGPLREMVNRIGAQAAILRRSMDRMWEDQSIETCDDWVIPYIADLLATNLVASLDARGQRLDVAKTIYYRRRKGTIAILEEIAADITGWNARIVEFFRRMGRTRHNLDPEIGLPSATDDLYGNYKLQLAEGLVGTLTHTGIGGWADLRNSYGATKTNSAFDEYFHTADFRRGRGQVGWYNIPCLGVFLWRLRSFRVDKTMPVEVQNCPGHYTFDPTGREIPLFAAATRDFGDKWVSPAEWQLPTPISTPLLRGDLELPVTPDARHPDTQHLYAVEDPTDRTKTSILFRSLGVFVQDNLIPGDQITIDPQVTDTETFIDPETGQSITRTIAFFIDPETGRLIKRTHAPAGNVLVTYHYGFFSTIGAGPFDRRIIGEKLADQPSPIQHIIGGRNALADQLTSLAPIGTISVDDSLTYDVVNPVGSSTTDIQQVTIMAKNESRPVIRLPVSSPDPTEWVFTGADGSTLALEGLFISGGDIVLRGVFDSVTLTCCTLDPGNSGDATTPPTIYAQAVDGRDLIPCRLWVEAQVRELKIDRCITGPIRTSAAGEVETLTVNDSIVQAIRTDNPSLLDIADLKRPARLATLLRNAADPLSSYLKGQFTAVTQQLLNAYDSNQLPSQTLQQALINELNTVLSGPALYDPNRFAQVNLTATTLAWTTQNLHGADLIRLNRWLLQEAYPSALADKDSVIALDSGEVQLTRCTLLGPAYLHQLSASECILDDIVLVEDTQHGCVRFSAWVTDSVLPQRYESVRIAAKSPLFTTSIFGQSGYAQLLSSVDTAILPGPAGTAGTTIAQGAQDGSEMGAFAREKNPIKERSLRIKYDEFMPLGLTPVIIYVT
jgi:hypothetical protein